MRRDKSKKNCVCAQKVPHYIQTHLLIEMIVFFITIFRQVKLYWTKMDETVSVSNSIYVTFLTYLVSAHYLLC